MFGLSKEISDQSVSSMLHLKEKSAPEGALLSHEACGLELGQQGIEVSHETCNV